MCVLFYIFISINDIYNYPFVIEEPHHSWIVKSQTLKQDLMKLGNLHFKRLVYMKHVHVIYQSMTSWTMYCCKGLNYSPHYQMAMNEIFSTYNEQKVRRKILHSFGSNSFVKVSHRYDGFNLSNKSIKSLTEKVLNAKKKGDINNRQNHYIDFGFTTSRCTSRSNDSNGISRPLLKPGSCNPLIVECFSILSSIAHNESCSWISDAPIYSDDRFPDRFTDFSSKICKGNTIEAIRIALVDSNNTCNIHEDKQNDPYLSMSTVISIGKIVTLKNGNIVRLSIIGYSRKSISDYYFRKRKYAPIIQEFVLYHNKVLHSLNPRDTHVQLQKIAKRNMSYMDPFDNLNLPVNVSLSIIKKFRLNYFQATSVISAYIISYHDSLIFEKACKSLLIQKKNSNIDTEHDTGYLIIKTMITLKSSTFEYCVKENNGYESIKDYEFKKLSNALGLVFLYIFQKKHLHSSKKKRTTLFQKVSGNVYKMYHKYKQYDSKCPIFQIAAIIGLVPFWIIYECIIDHEKEGFQYLMDANNMKPNRVTCSHLIESIRHILTRSSGYVISNQYIICVIHNYGKQCKINNKHETFRCPRNKVWKYAISMNIKGVIVTETSQHTSKIMKTPFICEWPVSNSMKTIYDILSEINIIIPDDITVASLNRKSMFKMIGIFGF